MYYNKFKWVTVGGTTGYCRTAGCSNSVSYGELYCFYCKTKMGM